MWLQNFSENIPSNCELGREPLPLPPPRFSCFVLIYSEFWRPDGGGREGGKFTLVVAVRVHYCAVGRGILLADPSINSLRISYYIQK